MAKSRLAALDDGLGVVGNHVFLVGEDNDDLNLAVGRADFAFLAAPQGVVQFLINLDAQVFQLFDFYHCFLSSVLLLELHTEGNLDVTVLAVTVTLKHISQAHCVACLNKSVIG